MRGWDVVYGEWAGEPFAGAALCDDKVLILLERVLTKSSTENWKFILKLSFLVLLSSPVRFLV